ncbi:hypothetical protein Dsin_006327 [Dipteronia sinensis]|uniref:Uncharacterized protein n=1 Tax=Dipteronia sinensis TaxID=43782 RepID=A0AAE0EHB5_9ROSI|nr:hypothetical protein Dsin_006327 [Dipteronia sinensis]
MGNAVRCGVVNQWLVVLILIELFVTLRLLGMQKMSRQLDLNKSFKLSVCSLLTTSSKQEGAALDTVEQLVEEQGLDPLFSE